MAHRERSCVFENRSHFAVFRTFQRTAQQGIFHNSVINSSFSELTAQFGIVRNGNASVIDQNAGYGTIQFAFQLSDNLLFCLLSFLARQVYSPPESIYLMQKGFFPIT